MEAFEKELKAMASLHRSVTKENLNKEYQKKHGREIPYAKYGFSSMNELIYKFGLISLSKHRTKKAALPSKRLAASPCSRKTYDSYSGLGKSSDISEEQKQKDRDDTDSFFEQLDRMKSSEKDDAHRDVVDRLVACLMIADGEATFRGACYLYRSLYKSDLLDDLKVPSTAASTAGCVKQIIKSKIDMRTVSTFGGNPLWLLQVKEDFRHVPNEKTVDIEASLRPKANAEPIGRTPQKRNHSPSQWNACSSFGADSNYTENPPNGQKKPKFSVDIVTRRLANVHISPILPPNSSERMGYFTNKNAFLGAREQCPVPCNSPQSSLSHRSRSYTKSLSSKDSNEENSDAVNKNVDLFKEKKPALFMSKVLEDMFKSASDEEDEVKVNLGNADNWQKRTNMVKKKIAIGQKKGAYWNRTAMDAHMNGRFSLQKNETRLLADISKKQLEKVDALFEYQNDFIAKLRKEEMDRETRKALTESAKSNLNELQNETVKAMALGDVLRDRVYPID